MTEPPSTIEPPQEFIEEYSKLAYSHLKLRKEVLDDFEWIHSHLIVARESSRSITIETINKVISYLSKAIPIVQKSIDDLSEQMNIKQS